MLVFIPDPYKANIADVSIHVSYDCDEDSPPLEGAATAAGNEPPQQQSSNADGSIVHGEDTGKMVDKTSAEQQEANQPAVESSKQTPTESHTEDTVGQKLLGSSDEASAEDLVETQEEQLPTSNGQEKIQTENQPTEDSTTEAENKDEP